MLNPNPNLLAVGQRAKDQHQRAVVESVNHSVGNVLAFGNVAEDDAETALLQPKLDGLGLLHGLAEAQGDENVVGQGVGGGGWARGARGGKVGSRVGDGAAGALKVGKAVQCQQGVSLATSTYFFNGRQKLDSWDLLQASFDQIVLVQSAMLQRQLNIGNARGTQLFQQRSDLVLDLQIG